MSIHRNATNRSTQNRKSADVRMGNIQKENFSKASGTGRGQARAGQAALPAALAFVDTLSAEIDTALEIAEPNPHLNMVAALLQAHLSGKIITATMLISASGVPYATARRKLQQLQDCGFIEQRARTRSGRSFSLHPTERLMNNWLQLSDRILRLCAETGGTGAKDARDYYFGASYVPASQAIAPPQVLPEPLQLGGGLRILVHGDPTFMVMENLKRQFEQIIGTNISQRAFSIDRLRAEALRNAERRVSKYDIIAVDLPWIGEFAQKGVLMPLDECLDTDRLDTPDFHTAGWMAAHWGGRPYGVPSQTTPELLFYRKDLFAEAGLEPPDTTDKLIAAARHFHAPQQGRYGIAWNAARGTALGHQFLMTCADFGQPIVNLDAIAGGFAADTAHRRDIAPTIDTPLALDACEFLLSLLEFSPPDILSMSWYERVRPYAAGKIAMAYGYTLLAPYFERDPSSPANGNTGYLPHPAGPEGQPVATVGGYVMGIPANIAPERRAAAAEALIAFTSPEAQKLYILNGSRTAPRYSVGADPEVRRISPIFEAVDAMSLRDELQYWPRPPIPQIAEIIEICGQELHDMLRGVLTPRNALRRAQARAEDALK
ncbi:multiple sugar transport system substrate-binding protein [Roseinatronobacter thiooxidans]|uniref:Multiple sugar transport system substrate-binding protein n=2 Tax=Roseinatronobacter thiooxidans TaxID=121821 RepID=A0A2W7PT85_9RHOB|nr:multiple sugar transport system substrate-binding protein [Roseinatronobacter thiooxidans]